MKLEEFNEFVIGRDHPCLMAQSVFRQQNFVLNEYGKLGYPENTPLMLNDIQSYLNSYNFRSNDFFTFIAVFEDKSGYSEEQFEKHLWQQLQNLHNADTVDWDPEVDSDPESDHFSFSLLGKAFYIVGMHPNSSRKARRTPWPAMIFNLHSQFEQLREMGAYDNTRDQIRKRDKNLQGSVNPMLKDFGHDREAMQYSGRKVDLNWRCPFHQKLKPNT